jgi:hypothetical protein
MANQEHVDRLLQGVEVWNQWRQENPKVKPNLVGADLKHINLEGTSLIFADLSDSDLSNSDLFVNKDWNPPKFPFKRETSAIWLGSLRFKEG